MFLPNEETKKKSTYASKQWFNEYVNDEDLY